MSGGIVRPASTAYDLAEPSSSVRAAPIQDSVRSRKKSKKSRHAVDDIADPELAKEREFFVEFSGRLAEMAGVEYMEKPLATPAALMHRPHGSAPGSARIGNATRAIVFGARLSFVVNNFPAAMVLDSNVARGRMYAVGRGDMYERGLIICPANWRREFGPNDGHFMLPHAHLFDPNVQRFSKVAGRNLLEECTPSGIEGTLCVRTDNPLVEVLYVCQKEIRASHPTFSLSKALMPTRTHYLVPTEIVKEAHSRFNEVVLSKMPHINLAGMTLRLRRYGADWAAPIMSGVEESANQQLLNMFATFSVGVTLAYRLPNDD